MQKSYIIILLLSIGIISIQPAHAENIFSKLKQTVTGGGTGEITDLGGGKYDILAAGGFSGNRSTLYKKWDRTAEKACNGGSYRIIEREFQSAEYPGLLGGIIQCGSAANKTEHRAKSVKADKSVQRAQLRLTELGYSPGKADGKVGAKTIKAIKEYQRDTGLILTGKLDSNTSNALYNKTERTRRDRQDSGSGTLSNTDVTARLRELNQLKNDGALTEEEFTILKKKIIQGRL